MNPNPNYEKFYSKETYEVVGRLIHKLEQEYHFKALFGRIAGSKTQGISSKSSDNDFLIFVKKSAGNVDEEIQGQVFKSAFINGELIEFEIGYIYWEAALEKILARKQKEFLGYPTNFYRTEEEKQKYLPQNMPKLMRFREEYPFVMFHLMILGDSVWISEEFKEEDFARLYALERTIDVLDTFFVRAYGNYIHYMKGKKEILTRKYIYTLSQIWAIEWILDKKTKPPMWFAKLMNGLEIEEDSRKQVKELININSEEVLYKTEAYIPHREELDDYIGNILEQQKIRIAAYCRDETFAEVVQRTPVIDRQKLYCEKYRDWRVQE